MKKESCNIDCTLASTTLYNPVAKQTGFVVVVLLLTEPFPDRSVCLDAPDSHVYQCRFGHLLCQHCFDQLRARAVAGQAPRCPTYRAELPHDIIRSLAAEQTIALLPATCRFCSDKSARGELVNHEANCPSAPDVQCCRHCEGCEWIGRASERGTHEAGCAIVRLCAGFDVERRETADETADVMGALLNTRKTAKERKNDALRRAAEYGLAPLVERLIAGGGADVDGARLEDGYTPLILACQYGRVATVKVLIAAGSSVDKADTTHGATPLYIAANEKKLDVVKLLIDARADVDKAHDNLMTMASHLCTWLLHVGSRMSRLRSSTRVQTCMRRVAMAPHLCTSRRKKVILTSCSSSSTREQTSTKARDTGATPLHVAARHGIVGVASALIDAGADANAKTFRGNTALSFALHSGHTEVVQKLRAAGATED